MSPHRTIRPPLGHLSASQHTEARRSLHQTLLPPYLPQPHHAFHIPNAVPLHPMKYLLTWHIDTSDPQFAATTAHDASPLPHSTSPCRKPQVSASTPPTPPLSPAACQCTSPVSIFLIPWVPFLMPRFSRSCPSAAWPSDPSPVWENPHAPPPSSWTFPPTKPRSSPQRVTPPVPLIDRTLLTLTGPPPLYVEFSLFSSRLGMPSQHSCGPPASRCLTSPTSVPYTWKSPHPQCISPRLIPWSWRTPLRIGYWLRRPSSVTASLSVPVAPPRPLVLDKPPPLSCSCRTSPSGTVAPSPLAPPLSIRRKSVSTWNFPSSVPRYALILDSLSPGISPSSAPGGRTPHAIQTVLRCTSKSLNHNYFELNFPLLQNHHAMLWHISHLRNCRVVSIHGHFYFYSRAVLILLLLKSLHHKKTPIYRNDTLIYSSCHRKSCISTCIP